MADPGKSIRGGGANFEIFSFRGGGGVSTHFTASIKALDLSFQNLEFDFQEGGRAPAAPLYKFATAACMTDPLKIFYLTSVKWYACLCQPSIHGPKG